MAKSFACRDLGMDCNFTVRAQTEDTLYKKIAEHARNVHNIKQMDRDTMAKVEAAIKEV